jgi:hypothetical protein
MADRLRRGLGGRGEPDGGDDVLDCFQEREMMAAGAFLSGGELQNSMCRAWSAARFGRGGISEDVPDYGEEKESERRRRDHLQVPESLTHGSRTCGPPMRNRSSLTAQSAAERRGKRRGEVGLL